MNRFFFSFFSFLFNIAVTLWNLQNHYWQVFMESCPFLSDQITKSFPLAFLLIIDQISLSLSHWSTHWAIQDMYYPIFYSILFLKPSLQKAWAEKKLIIINAFILFLSWKSNQLDAGTKSSCRNCGLKVGKTSKFSFL